MYSATLCMGLPPHVTTNSKPKPHAGWKYTVSLEVACTLWYSTSHTLASNGPLLEVLDVRTGPEPQQAVTRRVALQRDDGTIIMGGDIDAHATSSSGVSTRRRLKDQAWSKCVRVDAEIASACGPGCSPPGTRTAAANQDCAQHLQHPGS